MPQVPFPKQVYPVQLREPQRHARLAGRIVLGLAILAVLGTGAVTAYRNGAVDLLRQSVSKTDTAVKVEGTAVVPDGDFTEAVDTLVVQTKDLPAALQGYRVNKNEGGATGDALAGQKTVAGYRAVYEGKDPLDVFSSTVYVFASPERAAQTYVRVTAPGALADLVGQSVSVAGPVALGDAGLYFRESADSSEPEGRAFGGAVVLEDQAVHVMFGLFPTKLSDNSLQALAGSIIPRYEKLTSHTAQPRTDGDDDGLSDGLESVLNTDPGQADTDADGFSDLIEIQGGYDPRGIGRQSAGNLFLIPDINGS